jgi:hypothetical protein
MFYPIRLHVTSFDPCIELRFIHHIDSARLLEIIRSTYSELSIPEYAVT